MLVVLGKGNKNDKNKSKQKSKPYQKTLITISAVAITAYSINTNDYNKVNVDRNSFSQSSLMDEVYQTTIEKDPIEIDINEMLNDYTKAITLEDYKEINNLYEDKYIKFTGDINKIYSDPYEGNYITIRGDNEAHNDWMSIQCNFYDKDEIEKLNNLEKGEEVKVEGYCAGGSGMIIEVNDCELNLAK